MYIVSVKLNKKYLLGGMAALCIAAAVAWVAIPQRASDVLKSNVSSSAETVAEHIEFLNAYGYSVHENPVRIEEIVIPEQFGAEYERYNELQKLSGFDLSEYKNRRAKKYTYKVLNYEGSDEEVVANIIIYNGRVIGGDISSTVLGGFVHGFVKE